MNDAFASVPRSSRGVRLGRWVRRAVLCVLALVPLADDVAYAILESNGKVSFLTRS